MEEQSDKLKKIQRVQKEALTRPVIGGGGEDPRQVKLNSEVISSRIREARAKFDKGEINIEQFDQLTERQ